MFKKRSFEIVQSDKAEQSELRVDFQKKCQLFQNTLQNVDFK